MRTLKIANLESSIVRNLEVEERLVVCSSYLKIKPQNSSLSDLLFMDLAITSSECAIVKP